MRTVTLCLQVVGSACMLAIAVGTGKLLWIEFLHSVVAVGPLPPSVLKIATHLTVILVGGTVGLVLAVKAVQGVDRNDLRALLIAIQTAALLVPLLSGFDVQ